MTDPRDKPSHSKHVKSKTRETQYLKYRSFKPKCVESRVAGYIKTKKSRADSAGTAAISSSARLQQQQQPHHHHQPQPDTKTSRSRGSKAAVASTGSHQQAEAPSTSSEPKKRMAKRPTKKEHRLLHGSNNNGGSGSSSNHNHGKAHTGDKEDERKHKAETNIQADPRKGHSKTKQRHQHKKYKTFDIASFPRVFSTSDLMEKMNEPEANTGTNDPSENCEFQNVNLRVPPTAQPQPPPSHADDEATQQLEFRNEDVDIEITCHRSQVVEAPVFPQVDSMVFQCEPSSMVVPPTPRQRASPSEPGSSGERLLAQNFARENEALKKKQTEQRTMIDELHACVHKLQEELRSKGNVEQALQQSEGELRETRAELSAAVNQKAMLQGEFERNSARVEVLAKGNTDLAGSMAAPSGTEAMTALRGECELLQVANAELLKDLRKSQTAVDRLKIEVVRQEEAIRMLEDVKMASASQLKVYEAEMAFLSDANVKLSLENQQLEARNKRLLNVLALNHVVALSKQFRNVRSSATPSIDAALNTLRKRNRLQEIKHFNTSCQKFTTTE